MIKIFYKYIIALIVGGFFMSCDDFLDRKPLDQISPDNFLNSEDDLATFPINYYGSIFSTHDGWGLGIGSLDNNTDNQATSDPSLTRFEPGFRLVPQSGSLGMANIRAFNFFFETVLPKKEANVLTGNSENIDHYIGEVYMLRAMEYFNKLKNYGDFPIVLDVLLDQEAQLIEAAKRSPRNIVARQILADLDQAIALMKEDMSKGTRLTRDAALLAKSRVALYEASFLKYHQGTPRVPGEAGWPGEKMSYNNDFNINIQDEINFFLDEAISSSKEIADKIELTENSGIVTPPSASEFNGWNSYYDMFSDRDMSKYPEVLFWRQYDLSLNITHGVTVYTERGGNTGLTKGFVESFLMKNGLPIYVNGSGFHGDVTIDDVKKDRDDRLQLFMFGNSDLTQVRAEDEFFNVPKIINLKEVKDVTGYRSRKFHSYDPTEAPGSDLICTAGSPIFRAAEAYLTYIEASYIKNNFIDATADKYWKSLRTRAGIDADYNKTINATDMSKEGKGDWGAYSGGVFVDPTLYNIRRERRAEYMSEAMRFDDLIRWRSMDQVKSYIIEGFNLWDEAYLHNDYVNPRPGETGGAGLVADGSAAANVSSKELSKYLRPYQILNSSTNTIFNGYTWTEANYLSPIPYREMQLASPDGTADNSNLYQNPYWPALPNAKAER